MDLKTFADAKTLAEVDAIIAENIRTLTEELEAGRVTSHMALIYAANQGMAYACFHKQEWK